MEKELTLFFFSFFFRTLDDDMRSQMALDWIAREQETIGIISAELRMADHELETATTALILQ